MNYLKKILIISICTASNIFTAQENSNNQMSWPRITLGLSAKTMTVGAGSFSISNLTSCLIGAYAINRRQLLIPGLPSFQYSMALLSNKDSFTIESHHPSFPRVIRTCRRIGFGIRFITGLSTLSGMYMGFKWATPEWEAAKKRFHQSQTLPS